jgi:hypothetical protein
LPPVFLIFAKSGGENVLQPAADARFFGVLKKLGKLAAFPELVLELVGFARGALVGTA